MSLPSAERLVSIAAGLTAGLPLDPQDAPLVGSALEHLASSVRRADQVALHQLGQLERDRLIRLIAAQMPIGLGLGERALAVAAQVRQYLRCRWRSHAASLECPPEIVGSLDELIWRALKSHGRFPFSRRALMDIIAGRTAGRR